MTIEKTFFSDVTGVLITSSRAVFGSRTYAMDHISSVETLRIPSRKRLAASVAVAGAIPLLTVGIIAAAVSIIVMGIFLVGVGVFILYTRKDKFAVHISSVSGETDALVSEDEAYIQQVAQALNEAIIARG